MLLFGFTQIFHRIKSIFDLLNTFRKNVSKSEQTILPNLLNLKWISVSLCSSLRPESGAFRIIYRKTTDQIAEGDKSIEWRV